MKNLIKFISLLIIMSLFSCSNDDSKEPITEDSTSIPVFERPDGFPDGDFLEIIGASSTMQRSQNGITVNFNTNGLIPGNAYTLWWIVFGETPGPPASLMSTGHVVGDDGIGNFSAHLSTGPVDLSTSNPNASPVFNNPQTAEVHMVLRTHGAAVPEIINEQISGYFGGCIEELTLPGGPGMIWADSDQIGYCADMQVAKHPPVNN